MVSLVVKEPSVLQQPPCFLAALLCVQHHPPPVTGAATSSLAPLCGCHAAYQCLAPRPAAPWHRAGSGRFAPWGSDMGARPGATCSGDSGEPQLPRPPGAVRGRSGKQPTCVGLGPVPQASTPWATLSCRCFQKGAGSEGPQLPGRCRGVCSTVRWATTQTRLAGVGESRARGPCAEGQTWHIGVQPPSSRSLRTRSVSHILKY